MSDFVQLAAVGAVCALDGAGLVLVNRVKARGTVCDWSWSRKRAAYWSLMAASASFAVWLDAHYAISPNLMAAKAYCFAFPVGLLDLYFSNTKGVSPRVIPGAMLWCSTVVIRQVCLDLMYPNGGAGLPPKIIYELSASSVVVEAGRYLLMLVLVGLFSDVIFSPMHRLAHLPRVYKGHHKMHHEFTDELTALVLYYGALLDDFLMPFSTIAGACLYAALMALAGLEGEAYSNVSSYLLVHNTLMSHAHDVRCARLMAPLPDALNFVAYHRVHHLQPSSNFGLTEPSDLLWDWLLGVNTVRKLDAKGAVDTIRGVYKGYRR
ncbi:hypothetical protein M885DRAFT_508106 [Pelagophyceae sp. CCMP2097]|nr:hypothetical protein M885DRAFT_508106 [Pelagophyceae sp. CCMP2097]